MMRIWVYEPIEHHQTLRVPPAMEANVTDDVWSLEEVIEFIETTKGKGETSAKNIQKGSFKS